MSSPDLTSVMKDLKISELESECDQYQAKLTEVWKELAVLRRAAERLQAYADAHPCDHGPPCPP